MLWRPGERSGPVEKDGRSVPRGRLRQTPRKGQAERDDARRFFPLFRSVSPGIGLLPDRDQRQEALLPQGQSSFGAGAAARARERGSGRGHAVPFRRRAGDAEDVVMSCPLHGRTGEPGPPLSPVGMSGRYAPGARKVRSMRRPLCDRVTPRVPVGACRRKSRRVAAFLAARMLRLSRKE